MPRSIAPPSGMDSVEPLPGIDSLDPSAEAKEREHQREQIRCHDLWEDHIENRSKFINYKKTAVMMLSWEDSDLEKEALDQEVADLAKLFRETYGFEVFARKINSKKSPEKWLTNYLSNFVCDHDHEDTLLIIYYAGHGWSKSVRTGEGPSSLEFHLGDKMTIEAAHVNKKCRVAWHKVERILTDVDCADILGIFDCCDAGSLTNLRGPLRFEYLGACEIGGVTQPASESSFTRALIWALEQFAIREKPFFNVGQLRREIMLAPNFPDGQYPAIGKRYERHDSIVLTSKQGLAKAQELGAISRSPSIARPNRGGYLNLQFQFDSTIDDEMLRRTAVALHELIALEKISAKRITFLRKHEIEMSRWSIALEAVRKLIPDKDRRYLGTPPPEHSNGSTFHTGTDTGPRTSSENHANNGFKRPATSKSRDLHAIATPDVHHALERPRLMSAGGVVQRMEPATKRRKTS